MAYTPLYPPGTDPYNAPLYPEGSQPEAPLYPSAPEPPVPLGPEQLRLKYGSSEFTRGLRRGVEGIVGGTVAAGAQVAEAFGAKGISDRLFEEARALLAPRPGTEAEVQSYKDIRSVGDAGSYAAAKLGEFAPALGLGMAGGVAGAAVGAGLRVAPEVAGMVGGAGTLMPSEMGTAALTLRDDPEAMRRTTPMERTALAAGQGIVNSALYVPPALGAVRRAVGPLMARRGLGAAAAEMGIGAAESAASLGVASGVQEAVRQGVHGFANPARDASQDWERVKEATVAGAVGGLPMGALGGGARAARTMLTPDRAPPAPVDPNRPPPGYVAGYDTMAAMHRAADALGRKFSEWTQSTDRKVKASVEWTDGKTRTYEELMSSPFAKRLKEEGQLDEGQVASLVSMMHAMEESPERITPEIRQYMTELLGTDPSEVWQHLKYRQKRGVADPTEESMTGIERLADDSLDAGLVRTGQYEDEANPFLTEEQQDSGIDTKGTADELFGPMELPVTKDDFQRAIQNMYWYRDWEQKKGQKYEQARNAFIEGGGRGRFTGAPQPHVNVRLSAEGMKGEDLAKLFDAVDDQEGPGQPVVRGPLKEEDLKRMIRDNSIVLPIQPFALAKRMQKLISGSPDSEYFKNMTPEQRDEAIRLLKDIAPPIREGTVGDSPIRNADLAMHALNTLLANGIEVNGKRVKVELEGDTLPENLIIGGMPKGGKGEPYTLQKYTNEVRSYSKKGSDQLTYERDLAEGLGKHIRDMKTGRGSYNWKNTLEAELGLAKAALNGTFENKTQQEEAVRRYKTLAAFDRQRKGIMYGQIMSVLRNKYRKGELEGLEPDTTISDAKADDIIRQYAADQSEKGVYGLLSKKEMAPLYDKTAAEFYKTFKERNARQSVAREIDAYHEALNDLAGDRLDPRGETEALIADLQRYFDPDTLGEASPRVLKFQKEHGLMHFSKELLDAPELRNEKGEPLYAWMQRDLDRLYSMAEEKNLSGVFDIDTIADMTGKAGETDPEVYGTGRNVPPLSRKDVPTRWSGPFGKTKLVENKREVGDGGSFEVLTDRVRVDNKFFTEEERNRLLGNLDTRNQLIDDWGPYRLWQRRGTQARKWGFFHSEDEARAFLDTLPDDGFQGLRIKVGSKLYTLEQAKQKYGWDGAPKAQAWNEPSRATAVVYNPKTGRKLAMGPEIYQGLPEQMVSKLDHLQRFFPDKEALKIVDDTPLFTDDQGNVRRMVRADLDKALTVTKPTVHTEAEKTPPFTALRQDINPQRTLPGMGDVPARIAEGDAPKKAVPEPPPVTQGKLDFEPKQFKLDLPEGPTRAVEGTYDAPPPTSAKERGPVQGSLFPESRVTPEVQRQIVDDFGTVVRRDWRGKVVTSGTEADQTGKIKNDQRSAADLVDEPTDQAIRALLREEKKGAKFVGPVRVVNDGRQLARMVIKIAEKHGGEQRRLRYTDERGTVLSFEDGTRVRYSLQDDNTIKIEGLKRVTPTAEELAALRAKQKKQSTATPEELAARDDAQTARAARIHNKWLEEAGVVEKPKQSISERFRTEDEVRVAAEQHFYVTEFLPKKRMSEAKHDGVFTSDDKAALYQAWEAYADEWANKWRKDRARRDEEANNMLRSPAPEATASKSALKLLGEEVVNRRIEEAAARLAKHGIEADSIEALKEFWKKAADVDMTDQAAGERLGRGMSNLIISATNEMKPPKKPTKENMRAFSKAKLDVVDALFAPIRRTSDEAEAAFRKQIDDALGEKFDAELRSVIFHETSTGDLIPAGGGYNATKGRPEKISVSTIAVSAVDAADAQLRNVANHEIMHAAMTRVERQYGIEAAKKLVDAAQAQHVRDQVLAAAETNELRDYYAKNPEEMLVQAYAVWNDGKLKLNPANILQKFFTLVKKTVQKLFNDLSGDDLLANVFEAVKRGELKDKKISGVQAETSLVERIKAGFVNYDVGKISVKPPEPAQTRPKPPEPPPEPAQSRPVPPTEPPKPPAPPKPPTGGDGTTPPSKPPIDELTQKLRGIVKNLVGKEAKLYRDEPKGAKPGEVGWYVGREMLDQYTANMERLREVREARRTALREGDYALLEKLNKEERDLLERTKVLSLIYISPHLGEREAVAQTYHESLHAAFDLLLTPEERGILATAFTKGTVARRLREIFKNDAAVLEAIKDPEEAAAYGFRVYAMAPEQLQLGQRTKTLFDRVVKFFHDLFGIVTNEEKAQILMDNMLSGRRLERGPDRVVQALEAHMTGPQKLQKLARTFGSVMKGMWDVIATSSYERLMATENPALAQIAKLAYTKQSTENEPLGYIQAQRAAVNRFVNDFDKMTADMDLKKFNEAYEARIMGKDLDTAESKLIHNFFSKVYQYYRKAEEAAGTPDDKRIGFEKNYTPLVWDAEKVAANRKSFVEMLQKPEYEKYMKDLKATPNEIWDNISNYVVRGESLTDIINRNNNEPTNDFGQKRSLGFIKPEDRRPFMSDDHLATMLRYTQQMTRAAEYIRAFGKNGEKLTKLYGEAQEKYGATRQQLDLAQDYIAGIMGDKGVGMSRAQKDLYGSIVVYQNLRLLPLNLFSSLVDPLGIAVRSGSLMDAGETFLYNIKNIFRDLQKNRPYMDKDKYEKLAQDWGIIEDAGLMSNIGAMYENLDIRGTNKKISEAFFKYNLLNGWERNTKIMATKAAQRFMVRLKEDFFGDHNERYLNELGLKKSDIVLDSNGELVTDAALIQAHGVSAEDAAKIETRVRDATVKFVNQAVLNPTAADLPNWGSNPYMAPIFHLKQFMFTFQSTILKRIAEETKQGNYKPLWVAGIYVPGMIASDMMRALITNGGSLPAYQQNWDWLDYLYNGIDRSGLTGAGSLITGIRDDILHGGTGAESAMGPALEQLKNGVSAWGKGDQARMNWLIKAMPGQAVFSKALTGPSGAPPRE